MDLSALIDKANAFSSGIARLGPAAAGISLTLIFFGWVLSPALREWAESHRGALPRVILGLLGLGLVTAIVTALTS